MNDILLEVLGDDKKLIVYRKELNKITGSVTATILLQQLIFHASHNKYEPFYKFIEPCNNELYKDGDSWIEELGFTVHEFRTAYKKLEDLEIVSKKTNMNRVSFYTINKSHLGNLIFRIYANTTIIKTIQKNSSNSGSEGVCSVNTDSAFTYLDNPHLEYSKNKEQRLREEEEEILNLNLLDEYISEITNNKKTIKGSYISYRAGVVEALSDTNNPRHLKTLKSYKTYISNKEVKELAPKAIELLNRVVDIHIGDFIKKKFHGKYDDGIIQTIITTGYDNYEIIYQGLGERQTQALLHSECISGYELSMRSAELEINSTGMTNDN